MNLIQRYIQLKQQKQQIEKELQEIQEQLLNQIENEVNVWEYKVIKVVRYIPKIKENIDLVELQEKYPEIFDVKINTKKAVELGLDDVIELKETQYLQLKKKTKWQKEF